MLAGAADGHGDDGSAAGVDGLARLGEVISGADKQAD